MIEEMKRNNLRRLASERVESEEECRGYLEVLWERGKECEEGVRGVVCGMDGDQKMTVVLLLILLGVIKLTFMA